MLTDVRYDDDSVQGLLARTVRRYFIWRSRPGAAFTHPSVAEGGVEQGPVTAKPVGGKNIAFAYVARDVLGTAHHLAVHGLSDPLRGRHSEPVVMDRLHELLRQRFPGVASTAWSTTRINCWGAEGRLWLYTERAPCGKGPGMKNCTEYLRGTAGSMPVYFSFRYPSSGKQELDEIVAKSAGSGAYDAAGLQHFRQYWRDVGKEERALALGELTQVEDHLKQIEPTQNQQQLGETIARVLRERDVVLF